MDLFIQGKSYFRRAMPMQGKYDFPWIKESLYLLNVHAINCLLYQTTGDNFNTLGSKRFNAIAKQ